MNTCQSSFSFALRAAIFALVCTMWGINAEAVEAVGKVQFVLGDVTAVNGDESRQLKKMDPIYESDTIETGPKGSTQLMMMDSARIAVRPNSAFIIAEYRLDGDNSASVLSVLKGGFRTLSGKIGEQAKENYRVETPTGIIGLRGTDHAVFHIPAGQEKFYGDGLAGTYSKVYEGSIILQNEDKILVITPATDAGYVAKDAAPKYVKTIPETAEGPVVVAPFDETESDEEAADESEVAAAPDEESASETESEAEAEIVVADELPAESGDAAAETQEIAPAPEPAPEPTSEIARAPNSGPINEIPAETIADVIQRETEESGNVALAEVDVFTFSVDATGREGESFQISGETTARTVRSGGQIQFRIIGANPNEFTMSPGVACDSGGLCTAMLPVGEREFVFTLTPLYDEQPDAENWRIVLVNDNPRIFVEDSVQLEWNIAIADAADVDVFTFSVDATGREGESFQISGETTARTVRSGGQIQFRIIGANPNEFTMSPGVACDSGGLCTAMLPVGEREFVFTLTPLYDEQPDAENWRIVLVNDNPRIFVEDSVQLEWNIAIADAADVDVFTFSVDATGREGESFQISGETTARTVRSGGQIQFRIIGANPNEFTMSPGVACDSGGLCTAMLPVGEREFVFTLTPLYDEQPDAENWRIVLVNDNPRIFVEDSVQLEWNIAIADAADVDVFTFSVDATGREGESFQISGETTARTVRSGGQIQFRIIGANPNEFTMSPGVACDSGGLCTAMLPVGEREFVFTLTPLYDEQPDAENWRIVLVNDNPRIFVEDSVQLEWNIAIADAADVDVFTFSVDATGREGESFQISGETTARTVRSGGQIQFRIIGANPNEFTMSPGVACDSGGLCTAMLPVGEREFVFTLTPLYDEQPDAENWRIVLVNDNPRIFVEDSVQLEWNIAIADAADVDVFTFSVDATGREGESFQISGETTARTVRSGGQIQFRIIGANPNEFTMSPGVACDSGGLCTAMLPVGEREFVFTLTPLYDEQPDAENWRIVLVNDNPRIFVEDSVQLEWNIAIADAADVDVFTFSVDATGREGESFQISGETTARTVRSGGQIQFRIIGANPNEFTMSPGVACDSGGLCTAMLPVGEREFVFTLTPLYDEQPDAENWRIVLVDDNPRIFVEDSVQLEWSIAIADAADVDVLIFSVDDTGREGESFQISGETTARTVRGGGQIQFRIIGANPDEFTLSPGVTCDSGGLCTAMLPVGEREFVFTLTPLYDEQPDAEEWRIVLVNDNPRIFVEDSVTLEWNIAIADVVAEVQIAHVVARTTFDEGESVQLRISSTQTSPADSGGLQVRFRINGADRNEIGDLPTGVTYSTEDGVYSATIPAGQREFTFNLITLTDSTDEPTGEEWTVTLISDTGGLYTGNSQVAFTVIDPPVTPSVPANFFGGGFETLTNPDESLNLAVPTDWIIGSGGILAIQDPDRMGAPATGIDIFPGGDVYNAIAAGDESYVRFASGQNVFYRMDSDGRFVNNAEGNAGRLSRQGEGGADYFTFSYALETGDRTFLTNYQVETRFLLNARKSDGINLNDAREFSEGATETWQFGTTTRTELNQRETFFPVTGTVENLQANLDYGRVPVPNPEGTDFVPGSFDYDISGQASFGTDNSKIFSRFDVQVTDAERCRGADTGCYDDRLVGKFEADANP